MKVRPENIVSVTESDKDGWALVLWTPSGLPTYLYEAESKQEAQMMADQVHAVIRQWARVLKNVEDSATI